MSRGITSSSPEVSALVAAMKSRIELLERENALLERELADSTSEKTRCCPSLSKKP